jgi:hypothetical protein
MIFLILFHLVNVNIYIYHNDLLNLFVNIISDHAFDIRDSLLFDWIIRNKGLGRVGMQCEEGIYLLFLTLLAFLK